MESSQDSKYSRLAAGAAKVFFPIGLYQKYQSKKNQKAIFKETEEFVQLIKDGNIEEFKQKCLSTPVEEVKKLRMFPDYSLLIACACFKGHEAARFLIEELHFDVDEQAKNGETALIRAVHFNDYQMVEILLQSGANAELRTKQEIGALLTVVSRDRPALVDLLLRYGTCINLKTDNKAIQAVVDACSDKVKSVISFHQAWRRKKNMLVILDNLSQDKPKEILKKKNDPLGIMNKKPDLLKLIIRDYM
ncbi:unnamed protein product [Moneuplotes crassus]|uniref:Uncharacterized protein n=1 Tax=Euplotes crassus TaxID=5936 RepID=A0AAD1URV9_EUPCR|nr:unnamed protein product [Moneuplotes crassus]